MRDSVNRPPIHKSLLSVGTNKIDTKLSKSRLSPINRPPKGQAFYDTIAFSILCPKHQNIAVCNTYHSNGGFAAWLPFIYQSEKVIFNDVVEDSLCLILSDYEPNLLNKLRVELPFDTEFTNTLNVILPNATKSITRYNCLTRLHSDTPGFECCRHTSRIQWLNMEKICMSSQDQFWGTQIHYYYFIELRGSPNIVKQAQPPFVGPYLHKIKGYYEDCSTNTEEEQILKSLGITRKQIDLLFIDFFKHCFPTNVISFQSFADYLRKFGFSETNEQIFRLFKAFKHFQCKCPHCVVPFLSSIQFEDLLLGLAYIDGDCPQNLSRLNFIFKYYDQNRDGFLSEVEFREMVSDIHKNQDKEEIDRRVSDGMTGITSPKGMNLSEFYNRAKTHEFGDPSLLCKYDIHLLKVMFKDFERRTSRPKTDIKNVSFKSSVK